MGSKAMPSNLKLPRFFVKMNFPEKPRQFQLGVLGFSRAWRARRPSFPAKIFDRDQNGILVKRASPFSVQTRRFFERMNSLKRSPRLHLGALGSSRAWRARCPSFSAKKSLTEM